MLRTPTIATLTLGRAMLKQRIITGVLVAASFLVALVILPASDLSAISSTVLVFAAWEWSALAGEKRSRYRFGFTALVGLLMFAVWWALVRQGSSVPMGLMQPILAVAVLVWLMLLGVVLQYPSGWQWLRTARAQLVLGLVVLLFGAMGFTVLSVNPLAKFWIVYVVAIVVIADVGAYFSGKAFGRRKLAPQVSPGKTWEGFWGGFIAAQLLAVVFHVWILDLVKNYAPSLGSSELQSMTATPASYGVESASLLIFILIAGLLSAASVLGDLFESVLKRNIGVKDSGSLLPGHGGILDRIDGMLPSVPLLAFFVMIFNW